MAGATACLSGRRDTPALRSDGRREGRALESANRPVADKKMTGIKGWREGLGDKVIEPVAQSGNEH